MKYSIILTLLITQIFIVGCTTVTRGTKDVLVVESEPPGADVRLSNGMSGTTPTSFELPRKRNVVVTISKEGYETLEVNVTPKVVGAGAAGMAGNVLVGGLIGAAVDVGTGAMKDLVPNPVTANLVKIDLPANEAGSIPVSFEEVDVAVKPDEDIVGLKQESNEQATSGGISEPENVEPLKEISTEEN